MELKKAAENKYKVDYILPLADSTMDIDNKRLKNPYWLKVTAEKLNGAEKVIKTFNINDIDITGNILDRMYMQPESTR